MQQEQQKQSTGKHKKLQVKPFTSKSDVLGSYTGNPVDDEVPEQDADDL